MFHSVATKTAKPSQASWNTTFFWSVNNFLNARKQFRSVLRLQLVANQQIHLIWINSWGWKRLEKSINLSFSCWNYVRPVRSHEPGLRIAMMIDDAWPTSSGSGPRDCTFFHNYSTFFHNSTTNGRFTFPSRFPCTALISDTVTDAAARTRALTREGKRRQRELEERHHCYSVKT